MSTTDVDTNESGAAPQASVDLKFEAVVIPVADADRSKAFYTGLGWRLDADYAFDNGFRVVQLTPPGSPASVQFGTNITSAQPGTAQGLYLVVSDVEAARADLTERGAEVSEVFHPGAPGAQFEAGDTSARVSGPADERSSYSSFATFSDPDGNTWLLQEVTTRLPGRVDPAEATYTSVEDLEAALQRAAAAHGEHEARTGQADENWPAWYASYMIAERTGTELPQ
ncbi:VOC family protein [Jiangella anatolica]|uniref:Glyoxalase n=1 Tax=Jiangella anatolica TaxID=2670374 RepID=A0A2W2BBB9_9ACTN|nr:VOC family protein [Jiangella anatolica]PZF82560.1 glyoxalase [Jiangella anatolica]